MKVRHVLIALLLMVPVLSSALSLEEAMREVVSSNPEVQERIKEFRAVKQDRRIAFAGYLPTVDFIAAAGREETNKDTPLIEDKYLSRTEMAIILNWNIYRGNADKFNVDRQDARINASAYSVLEAINEKTLEMAETYFAAMKQRDMLVLAKNNVATHEKVHDQIQKRIDTGVGARSELEQATGRLALAYSNLVVTENNYEDAKTNFEKVYGANVEPIMLETPTKEVMIPKELSMLLLKGVEANPSIKVQKANIDVATLNHKMTTSSYLPTIDLELKQEWNEDIAGVDGDSDSRSAMLRLSYNLYNGGADSATRQKRVSELAKESETLKTMERQVQERLKLAWNAYTMIEKQMQYLTQHRDLSQKTLELYQEEFGLGRRTLLDILDTEEEYYGAERELVNAHYDHLFAKYRLLESTGGLIEMAGAKGLDMVGMGDPQASMADDLDMMAGK